MDDTSESGPRAPVATIDMLDEQIAVLDASGVIVSVNAAWHRFARENGGNPTYHFVGVNYLDVCDCALGRDREQAARAARLIRHILSGKVDRADMDYPCDSPTEERWYKFKVTRSRAPGPLQAIASHERIISPRIAENQLRLQEHLLDSVEQAVIATDLSGTVLYWNPSAERMYGWSAPEVVGRNIMDVTPTSATQVQAGQIMQRLQLGESWSGEFDVRHRSGRTFPIHITDSPLRNERHQLIGVIGVSTDISEQQKIDKALRLSDMVYQAIGDAIMVFDMDDHIAAINPAFTTLTAYAESDIIGRNVDLLKQIDDAHLIAHEVHPVLAKTGHWSGSVRIRRKTGDTCLAWLTIDTIYDEHERDKLRICMFSAVTDQKRAKETIWQQANFDALTGLPNRSMFRDRLEHEIGKAGRSGHRLALMFIDLDQFKEVNDTLGHDIGDGLLKQAAERLCVSVRAIDTVARIGGDEFTVILGELDEIAIVERVAASIVRTLAQPFDVAQNTIHVTASVGITLYPEDAVDADILIKNADQAMYAAKNNGRDRFHYFTQRMQHEALVRMRIINDLRVALAHKQFELVYQPIVVLASGAVHKAEALLRWRHPVRGLISPDEFIPVAEQTGLISAIGEWVYECAIAQAEIWRQTIDPHFKVSVNMSPVQLRRHGPAGVSCFARHSHPAPLVWDGAAILEITESLLLESNKAVLEQLQALRDVGVQLAIDDFGTGYSALSYLRKFHVDYLKIDQVFVKKLSAHSDDLSMCEAIIAMAHKLGIKVIAEGIEREEQRDLLAQAGCDYGQGYLFARPLSVAQMGGVLAAACQESP